jgi:hypothetical protein
MDKFDQTIKDAQEAHEPSEHFVDDTMKQVMEQKTVGSEKKRVNFRLWVPIAAGVVIVLALVFVLLPSAKTNAPGSSSKTNVATTGMTSGTSGEKAESATIPSGTSNADLASDLSNVQGAINQENTDQSSANSALNDQSQEITVPTD